MTDLSEQAVDLDEVVGGEPAGDGLDAVDEQLIARLAGKAREGGLALTGEGGLLAQLTKRPVESALEGELTDHLGYDRHDAAGRDGGNSRNGHRAKTVLTEVGPVEVDVPRDRDGSFEPKIVAKRQRRLSGVDELVISLSAKVSPGTLASSPGERSTWLLGLEVVGCIGSFGPGRALQRTSGGLLGVLVGGQRLHVLRHLSRPACHSVIRFVQAARLLGHWAAY
jgi:putative transposase